MNDGKKDTKDRELVVSRTLNAPIEQVWESWTIAEKIAQWWGPEGFTNTIQKMDIRTGGEWELWMHGPEGTDFKNKSIFQEIIPFKKIVYAHITGLKFMATIDFTPIGEKTQVRWQMVLIPLRNLRK
jgi:uncharacterized protein YndB with AHSA1/START domain